MMEQGRHGVSRIAASSSTMVDSASQKRLVARRLVVLATLAVLVAGLGYLFVETRREQAILADFERRGFLLDTKRTFGSRSMLPPWTASVIPPSFGWRAPIYPSIFIDNFFHRQCQPGESFTNDDLRKAADLSNVRHIFLSDAPITDAGLVHLRRMTGLQSLCLHNMRITDAGADNLKGLTNLEMLWLANTQITDAGLVNFAGMKKKLEWPYFSTSTSQELRPAAVAKARWRDIVPEMSITDAGLAQIEGFKELRFLILENMPITDAGLPHLAGLTKLRFVNLKGTKVTPAGIAKLRLALPATQVVGP
jgi:hypothetical protein